MDNDNALNSLIQVFLAQMDSAMKVSDILAKHDNSDEITVDHLIGGLVYRLMVPMTNDEVDKSIEAAKQIMYKIDASDSGSDTDSDYDDYDDYDEIEETYDKTDFGSRKVKPPTCNCDICCKLRVCLINFSDHDCSDQLAQKFKHAIDHTCNEHKIYV